MPNAAQVKLGRRDARLLIDVAAVAHGTRVPTCRMTSAGRSVGCWDSCGWVR
jgi:hypothetical protein